MLLCCWFCLVLGGDEEKPVMWAKCPFCLRRVAELLLNLGRVSVAVQPWMAQHSAPPRLTCAPFFFFLQTHLCLPWAPQLTARVARSLGGLCACVCCWDVKIGSGKLICIQIKSIIFTQNETFRCGVEHFFSKLNWIYKCNKNEKWKLLCQEMLTAFKARRVAFVSLAGV